ncbi:hypothetical protein A2U01_0119275, partial [Trifolium medium]|nr:hypothetical protein [Trifolium medium]
MTEGLHFLSTCWRDAPSFPARRAIGRNFSKPAQQPG